jgi:hypothetical protein
MNSRILAVLAFSATTALAQWAAAETDLEIATAKLGALPGLRLMNPDALTLQVDGPGFSVSGIQGDYQAALWKGDAGWLGAVVLTRPGGFVLSGLDAVGTLTASSVVVVVSEEVDVAKWVSLPSGVVSGLTPFMIGGATPVNKGANLFVVGTFGDTGVLGQLKGALGMSGGSVTARGTAGEDVLAQALTGAGAALRPEVPVEGPLALTLTLPSVVPSPFKDLTGAERGQLDLEIMRTTLELHRSAGAVSLDGSMVAKVKLMGAAAEVSASLTFNHQVDGIDIVIKGEVSVDSGNFFGISGVNLKGLGIDAALSGRPAAPSAGLAVTATVEGGGLQGTARVVPRLVGGKLKELAVIVGGTFAVTFPGGTDSLATTNPELGVLVDSGEGFVSGALTWRGMPATGLLYHAAKPAPGAVMFVGLTGLKLSKLLGKAPPAELTFPGAVMVMSSMAMPDLAVSRLPRSAAAMLESIGVKPTAKISAGVGQTVLAAIDLGAGPLAMMSELGLGTTLSVAGTVGGDSGKPTLSLTAEVQPPAVKTGSLLALGGGKARFFVELSAASQLSVGIDGPLLVKLDRKPMEMDGRLYAVLGKAGTGPQVTGVLRADWIDALGMAGVQIKKGTTVAFSPRAEGAAKVMLTGTATFEGRTFELSGGVSVAASTTSPVIKGIALRLAAPELGVMNLVKLGQLLIRSSAVAAADLPTSARDAVTKIRQADLLTLATRAVPQSQLTAQGAAMTLHDAVAFLFTPGMDPGGNFPRMNDVGMVARGALKLGGKPIGAFDATLTAGQGLQLKSGPADFSLGPLALKKATIDTGFTLAPATPRFVIKGVGSLGKHNLGMIEVNLSALKTAISGTVEVFGTNVAVAGEIKHDKSFVLTGNGTLRLPKIGAVKLPEAGAAITVSSTHGVKVSFKADWENAPFAVTGMYAGPTDFSLTAVAPAGYGAKDFDLAGTRIGTLTVKKGGSLFMKLTPGSSELRFGGGAAFTTLPIKDASRNNEVIFRGATFFFDLRNELLTSDLRIKKVVRAYHPGKRQEIDFDIDYRVFP